MANDSEHDNDVDATGGGFSDSDGDTEDNYDFSDQENNEGSLASGTEDEESNDQESKKTHKKVLSEDKITKFQQKIDNSGIIYMSRVPPNMRPTKVKQLLQKFGAINRIYLRAEDDHIRKKRAKSGGSKRKQFVEGWIEFESKKIAKLVAATLNNTPITSKKNSRYADDLWNLKYLSKFKWLHLKEQMAYEKKEREKKMQMEIEQAKKEVETYIKNSNKSKMINAMEQKKLKRGLEETNSRNEDDQTVLKELQRKFKQRKVAKETSDGAHNGKKVQKTHLFQNSEDPKANCLAVSFDDGQLEVLVNLPIIPDVHRKVFVLPNGLKNVINVLGTSMAALDGVYLYDFVDTLLVTNPFGLTGLPYLMRTGNFDHLEVYAVAETVEVARLMMLELVEECRYMHDYEADGTLNDNEILMNAKNIYSIEDVDNCLSKINIIQYGEVVGLKRNAMAYQVVAKRSGYALGCANWSLKYFDYSMFIMDKSSMGKTLMKPFDYSQLAASNSVLMLQKSSAYSNATAQNYQELLKNTKDVLGKKKSVYMTDFGFDGSICLDLVVKLRNALPKTHIILLGRTFQDSLRLCPKFTESFYNANNTSPLVTIEFGYSVVNELTNVHYFSEKNPKDIMAMHVLMNKLPCIVLDFGILTSLNRFSTLAVLTMVSCPVQTCFVLSTHFKRKKEHQVKHLLKDIEVKHFTLDNSINLEKDLAELLSEQKAKVQKIVLSEALVSTVPQCISCFKPASIEIYSTVNAQSVGGLVPLVMELPKYLFLKRRFNNVPLTITSNKAVKYSFDGSFEVKHPLLETNDGSCLQNLNVFLKQRGLDFEVKKCDTDELKGLVKTRLKLKAPFEKISIDVWTDTVNSESRVVAYLTSSSIETINYFKNIILN